MKVAILKEYTEETKDLVIAEAQAIMKSIINTYGNYIENREDIPEYLKDFTVSSIEDTGRSSKQITFTGPTAYTILIQPVIDAINNRDGGSKSHEWTMAFDRNSNTSPVTIAEDTAKANSKKAVKINTIELAVSQQLTPLAKKSALKNLDESLEYVSQEAINSAAGRQPQLGLVGRRMEPKAGENAMSILALQRAAMRANAALRAAGKSGAAGGGGGVGGYRRTKRRHTKRRHTKRRHTKRR